MKSDRERSDLFVRVSSHTKKLLDSYVFDKHGTNHALSFEVDKILYDYLTRQPKNTHTQIWRQKNHALFQIKEILDEMGKDGFINEIVLEKRISKKGNVHWGRSSDLSGIIGRVKGFDQRTIDTWTQWLIDLEILVNPRPVPNSRKIIFSVDFSPLEPDKGPLVMSAEIRKANLAPFKGGEK